MHTEASRRTCPAWRRIQRSSAGVAQAWSEPRPPEISRVSMPRPTSVNPRSAWSLSPDEARNGPASSPMISTL